MSRQFSSTIDLFVLYAFKWVGTPYHWGEEHGGDDFDGMDCSGFVSECLRAFGFVPNRWRRTAEDIHDYLLSLAGKEAHKYPAGSEARAERLMGMLPNSPVPGAIRFFMKEGWVYHCEVCISDGFVVGAIGGDSTTRDDDRAAVQNAFVKLRPVNYAPENKDRKHIYINPFAIKGIEPYGNT